MQQEYAEFNWKTHNDLTCLQANLEQMMIDYAKMEESNLEQQGIITGLEHTYEDLREQ